MVLGVRIRIRPRRPRQLRLRAVPGHRDAAERVTRPLVAEAPELIAARVIVTRTLCAPFSVFLVCVMCVTTILAVRSPGHRLIPRCSADVTLIVQAFDNGAQGIFEDFFEKGRAPRNGVRRSGFGGRTYPGFTAECIAAMPKVRFCQPQSSQPFRLIMRASSS